MALAEKDALLTTTKVARFEDGVIQETAVNDSEGMVAETYYRFKENSRELIELRENLLGGTGEEGRLLRLKEEGRQRGGLAGSPPGRREPEWFPSMISFLINVLLVIYVAWAVNPFVIALLPKTKGHGPSYQDQVPRFVLEEVEGCDSALFCEYYVSPTIRTSAGSFYPNFTNDAGLTVDYYKVLLEALSILSNQSCGDYKYIARNGRDQRGRAAAGLEDAIENMRLVALELEFGCHPELLQEAAFKFVRRQYGVFNLTSVLPRPQPGPCERNWTELYNTEIPRTRRTTKCPGAGADSGAQFLYDAMVGTLVF